MAYAALGITTPLGMLARLSRRRLLYLPINGLQRLAIWGWVYVDSLRGCEEWRRLKAIRDKEAFAKRMMAIFPAVNFDKEVKKIQEDPWGWLSGDL